MSKQIQVILLEHISSVGQAGDIVSVSEGYARNSLFPEGKAALATSQRKNEHKAREQKVAQTRAQSLEEKRGLAEEYEGTELVIVAKVKSGEEIYGSIKKSDIIKELKQRTKLELKPKQLKVKEPIKQLGTFEMIVMLDAEVEFDMKLAVVPDSKDAQNRDEE